MKRPQVSCNRHSKYLHDLEFLTISLPKLLDLIPFYIMLDECCAKIFVYGSGLEKRAANRPTIGVYSKYGISNGRAAYQLENEQFVLFWTPNNKWQVIVQLNN